jgi:hypothetical protein
LRAARGEHEAVVKLLFKKKLLYWKRLRRRGGKDAKNSLQRRHFLSPNHRYLHTFGLFCVPEKVHEVMEGVDEDVIRILYFLFHNNPSLFSAILEVFGRIQLKPWSSLK